VHAPTHKVQVNCIIPISINSYNEYLTEGYSSCMLHVMWPFESNINNNAIENATEFEVVCMKRISTDGTVRP